MIIALFGVTCVGKTTIGRIIAEELGYDFYDLDEEIKSYYNDTITNIQNGCLTWHTYDGKKIDALKSVLWKCKGNRNSIIAMSPIYYTAKYKKPFKERGVFLIELKDWPEEIAQRIVYTDDDDNPIEDFEIDIAHEIKETKRSISYFKNAYDKIENKYFIDGKTAHEAAKEIIDMIQSGELIPAYSVK